MSSYCIKEAKIQNLEKQIETLYKLNFYLYEKNREIKKLKKLNTCTLKKTNELIEFSPEFIEKHDIINKYIEFKDSGFIVETSDPYLAACLNSFQYTYFEEIIDIYYSWKILELEKKQYLNKVLGPKANESNYVELQQIKLAEISDELEKI